MDWPPGEELASFSDARDVCESEGLAVFAPADTVHMALTAAVLEDEVNEVELFDFFLARFNFAMKITLASHKYFF